MFKLSRNPFTICWLVEILQLVSDKFNLGGDAVEKKLKLQYLELYNSMLSNLAAIIEDKFKISFTDEQTYSLAFPPTVYELLWRHEYITFRGREDDIKAGKDRPTFFDYDKYKQMREKRFEYRVHKDSIFSQMEILTTEPKVLAKKPEFAEQQAFYDQIAHCIRQTNDPKQMLE